MSSTQASFASLLSSRACTLPARAGVGLKPAHFQDIVASRTDMGFFEIHAENYMVAGGPFHHYLTRIRAHYPLSIHGVGLSIGAASALDKAHLSALRQLLDRYQPQSFSEHLAWSTHETAFMNDLLPLPYHNKTLQRVCDHIDQVQLHLGRRMLLENPATYVEYASSTWDESAFIAEVIRRTGCGLLLDVNNVYVSSVNHHRDPKKIIQALPLGQVEEIHLAGSAPTTDADGHLLLIDSHGAAVAQAVWALYAFALAQTGPVATLIERDADVPPWPILMAEAQIAERYLLDAQDLCPSDNIALSEVAA